MIRGRNFNRRQFTLIVVVASLAVMSLLLVTGFYVHHEWTRRKYGLTSKSDYSQFSVDGTRVARHVPSNSFDEPMVVVVLHQTKPRNSSFKSGSTTDPVVTRSSYQITAKYPADVTGSGLWIDGVKRDHTSGFIAVYVPDTRAAIDITVSEDDRAAFVKDAMHMDGEAFIEKWINPEG